MTFDLVAIIFFGICAFYGWASIVRDVVNWIEKVKTK